jgi:hypothetical protein
VQDLSYGVHVKGKRKVLLRDVSFHVDSGDMCALMVCGVLYCTVMYCDALYCDVL